MFNKSIGLEELVNLEDWQKVQDYFAEATEVTLKTVSLKGGAITKTSRPTRLCSAIFPEDRKNGSICNACKAKKVALANISEIRNITDFKCPFGLEIFAIPIEAIGKRIVSYIILGPLIIKARRSQDEYARLAKSFGIDPETILDALIEINIFSYSKVYSITSLISTIFSYMAQTGYHKKRLGEIAPEILEMDPMFSKYYEEKILRSLLNTCLLALGADSGSVMVLDRKTNMLHIKAASKINDDIINKTEIKTGEGIAGLAAATAQPIILPKDKGKNDLNGKMTRRDIKSSMIVPFNKSNDHDVYGVINLNIMRKDIDFSDKDIKLVKELVNLAGVALTPVQGSVRPSE